jgi:hypothetical protein
LILFEVDQILIQVFGRASVITEINANCKPSKIFDQKSKVTRFEMTKASKIKPKPSILTKEEADDGLIKKVNFEMKRNYLMKEKVTSLISF